MTNLFAWQRAVIGSALPASIKLTALRVSLDSSQATGRDVVVNADQVAVDLAVSERTVWRRITELVAGGWMRQTARPTYGGRDSKGRRARYELTHPVESSDATDGPVADDEVGVVCHDTTGPCQATICGNPESPAKPPEEVSDDNPSRLTKRPESCATATADDGTLSASGGSNNAAAAASRPHQGNLPGPISILAGKIAQHTPLRGLRWDHLGPDRTAQLLELIAIHGDQRLVDHAVKTCREPYPTFAQAFLAGWSAMPRPGQRLALVKDDPCTKPGHNGTERHCIECASEHHERYGRPR